MKATWIGYGKRFLQALRGAAPVILFFLTGFASVYALFGMQYVCVVSVVTVFFQMRHKKNDKTPRRYLRLLVTGTFLMICAYVSTLSLASCLLLNLLIPFVLVFTQSSQFNPKGYFSYAMIFVFLSLMPPDHLGELAVEIVVFFFCVGLLAVSIRLYTRLFSPPASVPFTLEKGLSALADMVRLLPDEERRPELEQRFSKLEQEFHRQSYHQNFFRRQNPENGRQDMLSTMMQRFSYLLTDNSWRNELQEDQIRTLRETAALMEETAKRLEFLSHKELTETCQKALKRMTIEEGRIRIFCRSMLHMLILMQRTGAGPRKPLRERGKGKAADVLHQLQSWLGTEVRDVIASNGSRIFRAGELIGCEGVGGETAFQLYQALSCSGCAMMLETASHGRLVIGQQESGTSLWSQAYHLKTADLLRRLPSLKICKITVLIQNDIQQRQVPAIANRFSSLRWLVNQLGNVEFLPDGVSKATAIRYYCQSEGIRREETAFIGDEINDIEAME